MVKTFFVVLSFCLLAVATQAQETTISLNSATLAMQTGQDYLIDVRIDDVTDLWLADMVITYDPQLLYVYGTSAGSPMATGELLSGGLSIVNRVDSTRGEIRFTISLLNPAEPVDGGGVVGRFRVMPLQSGTTELRFQQAQLASVTFETDASGQRLPSPPQEIPFLPVLLSLTIAGDPATPPSEATATPTPSPTPETFEAVAEATREIAPTLVNVTAVPRTPEPIITETIPVADEGLSPLLLVGVGMVVLAILGLFALFFFNKKR